MEDSNPRAPPRTVRKAFVQCLRLTGIATIAVLSVGYLLPTAVALYRRRMSTFDRWLLFMLNVGAGWTIVGWFAAMGIALGGNRPIVAQSAAPTYQPAPRTMAQAHQVAPSPMRMPFEQMHAARRRVNAEGGWVRYRRASEEGEHRVGALAARGSWRIDVAGRPSPPGLTRIERFALMDLEPTDRQWHRRGLRA